jgi:hypothetical protein
MAVMKTKKSLGNDRKYKNEYIVEFRSTEGGKRTLTLKRSKVLKCVGRDRLYVK